MEEEGVVNFPSEMPLECLFMNKDRIDRMSKVRTSFSKSKKSFLACLFKAYKNAFDDIALVASAFIPKDKIGTCLHWDAGVGPVAQLFGGEEGYSKFSEVYHACMIVRNQMLRSYRKTKDIFHSTLWSIASCPNPHLMLLDIENSNGMQFAPLFAWCHNMFPNKRRFIKPDIEQTNTIGACQQLPRTAKNDDAEQFYGEMNAFIARLSQSHVLIYTKKDRLKRQRVEPDDLIVSPKDVWNTFLTECKVNVLNTWFCKKYFMELFKRTFFWNNTDGYGLLSSKKTKITQYINQ